MKVNNPNKIQIGKKLYPIDNSYCYNIETKEQAYLAGTAWEDPKLVQIISAPFIEKNCHGDEHEFVKVKYEGRIYVVLNYFTDIFESPTKSRKSFNFL